MKASPDDRATPPLADAPERDAIRSALTETMLVEAAAGTGKTTSLVERMVALVRTGTRVDEIVAVTFTIKAAAELDERFQVALERAAREAATPVDRGRFEEALRHLDTCFVGTIHAFCARLLRERPVEAGLEPGFTEMDEAADRSERAAAWRRFGERLFLDEDPTLEKVLSLGIPWKDLEYTFHDLCENEDVEPAARREMPMPDLSRERSRVESYLDDRIGELPPAVPAGGWDTLQSGIRQADRLRRILGNTPAETAEVLESLENAATVVQKRWPNAARAVALRDEHVEFEQDVVAPALRAWREYLHPILLSLLRPAVESYRTFRRQSGRASFQDLLMIARNLLRDHPAVRTDLQKRFPRLLVDEFQDTDPIQAEVVLYLTGSDVEESNCWRLVPLAGSLFVVGDPKQSIYRFRRADIETYNRVRESIRRSGGRILQLTTNFRSAGIVCDWVNGTFAHLLPAAGQNTPEQAPHVPLHPFEPAGGPEAGVFRLEPHGTVSNRPSDLADADSRLVSDAIAGALSGRGLISGDRTAYQPGDFLILLRRRNYMRRYAQALECRGIPFEISGGDAFGSEEDLATLVTALRAIADPDDPVPLVASLRGPLFGVDDRALFLFKKAGGHFHLARAIPKGTDPRIEAAFAILREGQAMAETLPPSAAVSRFAERLGWVASHAAGPVGDTRAGNLLKAFSAARERSREGASFAELVRHLRELAAVGEAEEMTTMPGRPDAVRLMTVHGAKGLEARVVFLADPTDWDPPGPRFSVDREREPPHGHFLVWKKFGEFGRIAIGQPRNWEELEKKEVSFEEAEKTRLLYVASTRARETAIVSVRRGSKGQEWRGPWADLGPFLERELPPPIPYRIPDRRVLAAATLESEREVARHARLARRVASGKPSYGTTTVTALAHEIENAAARPFASATGKGMSWGSALHRILEAVMRDPSVDLRVFAANVLAEEDRPPEDLEEALSAVEGVRGSPLWKRALASRRCLVEVPFTLSVASADLGKDDGPSETLLSGAIDLVFEEDDGWVLVDYKSDTVRENLDALVRFYEPQLAHYRKVWEETTGRPTRAGLYFLDGGREVWL